MRIALLGLAALGCGPSTADSDVLDSGVSQDALVVVTTATVRATLGPDGGTLETDDGTLVIDVPPGALDADVELSIVSTDQSGIWRLLPAGLTFDPPLTARLRLEGAAGALLADDQGRLEGLHITGLAEGDALAVDVPHFSWMIAVEAEPSADGPVDVLPVRSGESFTPEPYYGAAVYARPAAEARVGDVAYVVGDARFEAGAFRAKVYDRSSRKIQIEVQLDQPRRDRIRTTSYERTKVAALGSLGTALGIIGRTPWEGDIDGPTLFSGSFLCLRATELPVLTTTQAVTSWRARFAGNAAFLEVDGVPLELEWPGEFGRLDVAVSIVQQVECEGEGVAAAAAAIEGPVPEPQGSEALTARTRTEPDPAARTLLSDGVTRAAPALQERIVAVTDPGMTLDEDGVARLVATFPCGDTGATRVFCASQAPPPTGEWVWLVAHLAEAHRVGDGGRYQFAWVFDTDGSAVGDWEALEAFPADFFQGTDRWYTLDVGPGDPSLQVRTTNGGLAPVASAARLVLDGRSFGLLVPRAELGASPSWRVTTFRHEGDYGLEGGPWSGTVWPPVAGGLVALDDRPLVP